MAQKTIMFSAQVHQQSGMTPTETFIGMQRQQRLLAWHADVQKTKRLAVSKHALQAQVFESKAAEPTSCVVKRAAVLV